MKIPCETCDGCGRVDSEQGLPWSRINRTPNPKVRSGEVTPKKCKTCDGRREVEAPEPAPAEAPAVEAQSTEAAAEEPKPTKPGKPSKK